ncbi:MAG: hypothetical protein HYX63_12220 [Gammaproteobacteria bacterium]|nr:hypothetical protein [Gammaproteobacteria bacterium]
MRSCACVSSRRDIGEHPHYIALHLYRNWPVRMIDADNNLAFVMRDAYLAGKYCDFSWCAGV